MISVIIPTYKEWDMLKICLEHLKNQTIGQDQFEVIVVNNSPEDTVPHDLVLSDNVVVLTEPQPGSYAARNKAIRQSNGEYLAFTDSDCKPNVDWLENGIKYLKDGYDLVGGKMEFFKPEGGEYLAFIFERQFSFRQDRNVLQNKQSITANLFAKRRVFDVVGLFDEKLLSGGDYEWTKRATDQGFKISYGEDVLVRHPTRKSFEALVNKKKRTSGGMYFSFFKDYGPFRKLMFTMHILRPPVTIFFLRDMGIKEKCQLFWARWYLEWVGVNEMIKLKIGDKQAERE